MVLGIHCGSWNLSTVDKGGLLYLYCLVGFSVTCFWNHANRTDVNATESLRFATSSFYCPQADSTWKPSLSGSAVPELAVLSTRRHQLEWVNQQNLSTLQVIHFMRNVFGKIFTSFSKRSCTGYINNTFWFITNENMKILKCFQLFVPETDSVT